MATLAQMAAAAGVGDEAGSGAALHEVYLSPLVGEITAKDAFAKWAVHTSDWHLFQALFRQCDGGTAAAALLQAVPVLARLLDPKQEPTLRLTALSLMDHLLGDADFAASPQLAEWAEHLFAAMLLPNLVWRAGKTAEHVRLGAMLCLSKLLPLPYVNGALLAEHMEAALPLLRTCLEDDNAQTRRLSCGLLAVALPRLGPSRLTHDWVRALYPELLKRLDDASDVIRLESCAPLVALMQSANYSAVYAAGANLDKTNYQYFLRGLLVHLDDPSPEIQQAVMRVVEQAMQVDPPVCAEELRAVRERHRSPKLCDSLIEKLGGLGELV